MRTLTVPLGAAAAAVIITLAVTSMTSRAAGSYADDRADIEDLQARYLFALDFRDPDLYVSTFAADGVLDVGSGEIKGRGPAGVHRRLPALPTRPQASCKVADACSHSPHRDW